MQIVQLMLPWFGNHDGELYYSAMSLSDVKVDKRRAFRIIRRWYKEQIGVVVDKQTLERLWKRRHVTRAVDESDVDNYLQRLARDTYEETESIADCGTQEEAPREAGV